MIRPAWAEIDLGAIARNVRTLTAVAAPAGLCAVVKARGYGHGAPEVARTAVGAGATHLAVALVEEGVELRDADVDAPVLLLSEPAPSAMADVVAARLTPTVYTRAGLDALRRAVGGSGPYPVHVKVDTGMHRVGASVDVAVDLAAEVAGDPALTLDGFWTHFAVSDETSDPYTAMQTERFDKAAAALSERGVRPRLRHAANSGGTLWHPAAHFDLVRCGIAMYGLAPAPGLPGPELSPALSLRARVSYVKTLAAGERISYGLRYRLERESVVATVPLGYADGVPRRLSERGAEVLIGGRRRPIAGTVTMDQVLVDCGPDTSVRPGDEVVLIGRQGDEEITAWDWATRLGTIAYEIVCGIGVRVPRIYTGDPWPASG